MQIELEGQVAGMETNTRVGVRYEKTDLVSTSVIAIPESIEWQANNDFRIVLSDEQQPFSEKTSYSYILPNLDFSIDFTDELKGRASFGKTIARAPYGNLYAGPGAQQPFGSVLIDPSVRASGNAQQLAHRTRETPPHNGTCIVGQLGLSLGDDGRFPDRINATRRLAAHPKLNGA